MYMQYIDIVVYFLNYDHLDLKTITKSAMNAICFQIEIFKQKKVSVSVAGSKNKFNKMQIILPTLAEGVNFFMEFLNLAR